MTRTPVILSELPADVIQTLTALGWKYLDEGDLTEAIGLILWFELRLGRWEQ